MIGHLGVIGEEVARGGSGDAWGVGGHASGGETRGHASGGETRAGAEGEREARAEKARGGGPVLVFRTLTAEEIKSKSEKLCSTQAPTTTREYAASVMVYNAIEKKPLVFRLLLLLGSLSIATSVPLASMPNPQ